MNACPATITVAVRLVVRAQERPHVVAHRRPGLVEERRLRERKGNEPGALVMCFSQSSTVTRMTMSSSRPFVGTPGFPG
jgi:hypothetical protein